MNKPFVLTFQQIGSERDPLFPYLEILFLNSFPDAERRPMEELKRLLANDKDYHLYVILSDEQPAGIFIGWDFSSFYYVEHFAIEPSLRNHGIGSRSMKQFLCENPKMLVLEVELPLHPDQRRRIEFYKRLEFSLFNEEYEQPPYRSGERPIPMKLMSFGRSNGDPDFYEILSTLNERVYRSVF